MHKGYHLPPDHGHRHGEQDLPHHGRCAGHRPRVRQDGTEVMTMTMYIYFHDVKIMHDNHDNVHVIILKVGIPNYLGLDQRWSSRMWTWRRGGTQRRSCR